MMHDRGNPVLQLVERSVTVNLTNEFGIQWLVWESREQQNPWVEIIFIFVQFSSPLALHNLNKLTHNLWENENAQNHVDDTDVEV